MTIATADFDVNDFAKPRAGDERLAIRFFRKAKQDAEMTAKEGRPIFKEAEYIQIMVPGDRNAAHVRPVAPGDLIRFEKQYDHWKKTQSNDLMLGTPLDLMGLTLAQVEEFRYFGIRSIEQMAELRDDVAGKIHGAQSLKQKAAKMLAAMKADAPIKQMNVELEKRDNEIATLRQAIEDQAALIKQLQTDKRR
jgi:hypothetical protein